ncbi:MAG: pyridoxamine 5'-phosphate oxidase [Verrucomicrobiia bacterium]
MGLYEQDLDPNPIAQFRHWFMAAIEANLPEPNAMTLATSTREGMPSARIVLLKDFGERGFVFFTNYQSQKGQELEANPQAALLFFWPLLERQIRIAGSVSKLGREESEAYFHSRPRGHQLGGWASRQSEVLPSRETLEARLEQFARQFEGKQVPLPPSWGGYCLRPLMLEFWQARPDRLHDRFRYTRLREATWRIERLSP